MNLEHLDNQLPVAEDSCESEQSNLVAREPSPFRVDVSLIPQAESKDVGALQDIPLQVYNQEDLEAGVVAQAERRMEETSQLLQLKRRLLHPPKPPAKHVDNKKSDLASSSSSATPVISSAKNPHLSAIERYFQDQEQRSRDLWTKKRIPVVNSQVFAKPLAKRSGKPMKTKPAKRRKTSLVEQSDDHAASDGELEDSEEDMKSSSRKSGCQTARDDAKASMYLERLRIYREAEVQSRQEKMERGEEVDECVELTDGLKIPRRIWNELYQYQKTGVKWLWELHSQEVGGILGDEMGLGKTVQIIAFLAGLQYSSLYDRSLHVQGLGPVLIICPATVLHQWVSEFHRWWPPARVTVLHASGSHSGSKASLVNTMVAANGVVLTTYQGVLSYQAILIKQKWHYVILDEGHKIRNPDSQITVACKQFRTPHRIILSGSPMQNNLRELWSLFDFVFPGKLGMLNVFLEQFSVPIVQGSRESASDVQVHTAFKCATTLKDTISPYLLRRSKADVKTSIQLPEKNEQVLFCQLTSHQQTVYEDYLKSDELKNVIHGNVQIFVGLMQLRKLCNHPDLFDGGPKTLLNVQTLQPIVDESEEGQFGYWRRSGKMIVVEALLKIWKRQNHKVLIFSQSRKMLDILERFMGTRSYAFLRMDGETPIGKRQGLIKTFNEDSDTFVFLLTTKVGGLGVNLTGATRVVIFDPDWNPSTDTQARERAWRIGQTKNVTIYRLLCAGTIEEKIYHRQIFKQYLTNRVLKDPGQKRFFKHNDLYELFTLTTPAKGESTETGANFGQDQTLSTDMTPSTEKKGAKDRLKQIAKAISNRISVVGPSMQKNDPEIAHLVKKADKKPRPKSSSAVDGETVDFLTRKETYQNPVEETAAELEKNNNYVLQKLFRKTTAHSAVAFEDVAHGTHSDHAVVEQEAQRVAKEAMRVLRLSRKNCHSASSGIPNWTAGFPVVVPRPRKAKPAVFEEDQRDAPPSACQLLSLIRQNVATSGGNQVNDPPDADNQNDEVPYVNFGGIGKTTETEQETATFATGQQVSLAEKLVEFLNFDTLIPGQAPTEVLVEKFKSQLPAGDANLFRALLQGVCDFEKQRDGSGVWILKYAYRSYTRC